MGILEVVTYLGFVTNSVLLAMFNVHRREYVMGGEEEDPEVRVYGLGFRDWRGRGPRKTFDLAHECVVAMGWAW